MVLKTCGTTTLLKCLALLLQMTKELGMELEWVGYSRKNYTFPGDQMWPHSSFHDEMGYLKSHAHLSARLNGSGHILGPLTGDHWFVYVADQCRRPSYLCNDRTINIMMFDMHPSVAQLFFKSECPTAHEMTKRTGICDLVPGATIDDFAFEPCGYSMNAILHGNYSTIHVTPEQVCSYASFETNAPLQSYTSTVRNTLNVFKPRRFVMTMFADDAGLKELAEKPFELQTIYVPHMGNYVRSNVSSTRLEVDTICIMANYVLCDAEPTSRAGRRAISFC
jgi:S-adenosylmethionine decarboxylase